MSVVLHRRSLLLGGPELHDGKYGRVEPNDRQSNLPPTTNPTGKEAIRRRFSARRIASSEGKKKVLAASQNTATSSAIDPTENGEQEGPATHLVILGKPASDQAFESILRVNDGLMMSATHSAHRHGRPLDRDPGKSSSEHDS